MDLSQPTGYLALPPTGQGNAVLVLHAWWGLNDAMKAICDRLAESGFVTFAPDLYHGQVTDNIADAESLSGALFSNLEQTMAEVVQAAAFLDEQAGQGDRGLAVIGFSLGAYFALDLSVTVPEVTRSVVIFYGTRPGDYSGSKAAYLGHFAETDQFESQADVDDLQASLKRAGRPVTFYRYPDTGHWFFEADRPQAYSQTASSLAWNRTLTFLRDSFTS
ncbi:MAG: dienelactone hydrolase family protein [Candidatus Promineifilaceae bacterium]|nr:dienelactone hydrolase family protein [Candidatus Promineifilaceae bacterium]